MDLGISGKRALCLAASRGLGLGVARALAAECVDVMMVGRDPDKLQREAELINAAGKGQAFTVVADLSKPEGVLAVTSAAEAALGGIDILLNNTGGPPPRAAAEITLDDFRTYLDAMVIPLTEITRHFLPGMRQRRWGRIMTIASWGVIEPIKTLAISNAIRASLVAWSKTLAGDVAHDGVTVNVLVPGWIATDRTNRLHAGTAERAGRKVEEVIAEIETGIPAGRFGKVEEFAAVAAFLASCQAGYVTGSLVRVDGGMVKAI